MLGGAGGQTALLTSVAMLAFAANSLLCRLALGRELIDAASFSTVRVLSGAVMLAVIVLPRRRTGRRTARDWRAALSLFVYMVGFSFAYTSLSAGSGALLLFGAVQLTMLLVALRWGERFTARAWGGLGVASAGLVYLVWPGVTAPDPVGAALMGLAGVAWGIYSLLGRHTGDPLPATAFSFAACVPFVLALSLVSAGSVSVSAPGIGLAVASGAVTSALGYVVWYRALTQLTAMLAATVQLSVPVIAALAAVPLLSEPLEVRQVVASIATLGGIGVVIAERSRRDGQ